MSTSLCVDNNIDALVEIIMDDAGLESETDAHDVVNHLAMQLSLLRVEMSSTTSVETTDDDVIITVKIPRSQ
jgi:hypothetical protein